MADEVLKTLLREYERKRIKAEIDLENRKEQLYEKFPRLSEIETELNSYAINTAKNILINNNGSLEALKEKKEKLKKEKEELLQKQGLNLSYLKPKYECNLCKDTGYIANDNYKTSMCNCLKQKLLDISYNKSNMSNLDKENFNTFNLNVFSNEIDVNKYKKKISPRENMKYIKQKSIEFIENFDNPEYKNLLFTGNTGLGKTFISNCIANELLKRGKTVLYQTAPVLIETIIDNKMSRNKTTEQSKFYKDVLECDLLIIDDLGTECLNSMKLSELFTVLNTRLLNFNSKITKTIISTNLNIAEIFNNYEERIGSRIAGFYDIYYFFGDDLRLKR